MIKHLIVLFSVVLLFIACANSKNQSRLPEKKDSYRRKQIESYFSSIRYNNVFFNVVNEARREMLNQLTNLDFMSDTIVIYERITGQSSIHYDCSVYVSSTNSYYCFEDGSGNFSKDDILKRRKKNDESIITTISLNEVTIPSKFKCLINYYLRRYESSSILNNKNSISSMSSSSLIIAIMVDDTYRIVRHNNVALPLECLNTEYSRLQ